MDPNQLLREIGSGKFRPAYYFYGPEDYRKAEAHKFIISNYIPGANKQLQTIRLSAEKKDLSTIIAELAAIPMLGERRVILIEDIQRLHPQHQVRLFEFMQVPPPETIVIFSTPATYIPDKRSAFFKGIGKVTEPIEFGKVKEETARKRITRQFEAAGLSWDEEAVDLILALTDGNFGGLVGELEKLSLAVEAGARIGVEEVKKLCSTYEEFSIFELIDLIAASQYEPALYAYAKLIKTGSSPSGLLVLLARQMMNLVKAQAGKQIAGHPFFVEKIRRQARDLGPEKTLEALRHIAQAEREIRLGTIPPGILVENLIRRISR